MATSHNEAWYSGALPMILLALVACLMAYAWLQWSMPGKRRGPKAVLILGPNNSGKTALFAKLVYGRRVTTFTSTACNEAAFRPSPKRSAVVTLVDVPGHSKIADPVLAGYRQHADSLLFVVDSVAIGEDPVPAAELLYRTLTDQIWRQRQVPLLLACAKSDLSAACSAERIVAILERQLQIIDEQASQQLQELAGTNETAERETLTSHGEQVRLLDPESVGLRVSVCDFNVLDAPSTGGKKKPAAGTKDIVDWLKQRYIPSKAP